MTDNVHVRAAEDLDTLRRSLDLDDPLTPRMARFLAACSGTLRAHDAGRRPHDATDPLTEQGDPR